MASLRSSGWFAVKVLSLALLAIMAWGWLAYVMAQPIKHPEPPAAWCWVGQIQFGLPCKYRSRIIDV